MKILDHPGQRDACPFVPMYINGKRIRYYENNPVSKIRNIDPYAKNNLKNWTSLSYNKNFYENLNKTGKSLYSSFELFKGEVENKEISTIEEIKQNRPNELLNQNFYCLSNYEGNKFLINL